MANAGAAVRAPILTGTPLAVRRVATRRPTLPVPPSTRTGGCCCMVCVMWPVKPTVMRRTMVHSRKLIRDRLTRPER